MNDYQWFYASNNERRGPFGVDGLVTELVKEKEPRSILVWHSGLTTWTEAGAVAEIASVLPPPLPVELQVPNVARPSLPSPSVAVSPARFQERPSVAGAGPTKEHGRRREVASVIGQQQYTQVGGWLALVCFNFLVISPIFMALNLAATLPLVGFLDSVPGLRAYVFTDTLAGIAVTSVGIAAGVQLVRIRANAVKLATIYLLLQFGYAVLAVAAPYVFGMPEGWTTEMSGVAAQAVSRAGIAAGVWGIYFQKSKRVAATYGHLGSIASRVPPKPGGTLTTLKDGAKRTCPQCGGMAVFRSQAVRAGARQAMDSPTEVPESSNVTPAWTCECGYFREVNSTKQEHERSASAVE